MSLLSPVKAIFRSLAPGAYQALRRLHLVYTMQKDGTSYLLRTGFLKSHELGYPCTPEGDAAPWMCYPIIRFMEQRLSTQMDVFEYGSGFSTIFWSPRVRQLDAVESDREWYEKLAPRFPDNCHVQVVETDGETDASDYVQAPGNTGRKYHVIIIDGLHRDECADTVQSFLRDDGIVLLDDTSREFFVPAAESLQRQGFRSISMSGLKPTGFGYDESTIFYRPDNCFGI